MRSCLKGIHLRPSLRAKSYVKLCHCLPQTRTNNGAIDYLLRVWRTKQPKCRALPRLAVSLMSDKEERLTSFKGDEYLHLPAIVDAAESSPTAAAEAAKRIRKFISKENHQRAYAQYNAIMLTRILTDNPAEIFTRNFDTKFVTTVKELLRDGRDMSVQQILRETLDYFEAEKVAANPSLVPLIDMWKKERAKAGGRKYETAPVSISAHMRLPG